MVHSLKNHKLNESKESGCMTQITCVELVPCHRLATDFLPNKNLKVEPWRNLGKPVPKTTQANQSLGAFTKSGKMFPSRDLNINYPIAKIRKIKIGAFVAAQKIHSFLVSLSFNLLRF